LSRMVVREIRPTKPTKSDTTSVRNKQFFDADGRRRTCLVLDAHSPTFSTDLLLVFRRNVARARRENKRVLGVADYLPTKS